MSMHSSMMNFIVASDKIMSRSKDFEGIHVPADRSPFRGIGIAIIPSASPS
jgi:hypothetical protein